MWGYGATGFPTSAGAQLESARPSPALREHDGVIAGDGGSGHKRPRAAAAAAENVDYEDEDGDCTAPLARQPASRAAWNVAQHQSGDGMSAGAVTITSPVHATTVPAPVAVSAAAVAKPPPVKATAPAPAVNTKTPVSSGPSKPAHVTHAARRPSGASKPPHGAGSGHVAAAKPRPTPTPGQQLHAEAGVTSLAAVSDETLQCYVGHLLFDPAFAGAVSAFRGLAVFYK